MSFSIKMNKILHEFEKKLDICGTVISKRYYLKDTKLCIFVIIGTLEEFKT